jgi:hypothetical protein
MKNIIYILLATIVITGSCATSGDVISSREERTAIKQENVTRAVESQQMVIKVNRLHTRRGQIMEMNPEMNFIIINNNRTRISLGYMGRSFTARPVAAINMEGEIYSRVIDKKDKGVYDITYELGQDNEKFTVNMTISINGYVNFSITNPRLDYVRYSGNLSTL